MAKDNTLRDQLDKLVANHSSSVMQDMNAYYAYHEKLVRNKYGRFCGLFEASFETLVEVLHGINYLSKEDWPPHRAVQFTLLIHNLKPIYGAYAAILSGSYEESIMLIRAPYEAFLRMVWMSCFPEDPYAALVHKPPKGTRRFNVTNFIEKDLGLQWLDYRIMSEFEHSNQLDVLMEVAKVVRQGQADPITLTYKFDEDRFAIGHGFLYFVMGMMMGFVVDVLDPKTSKNEVQMAKITKLGELRQVVRDINLTHPRVYRRRAMQDVESLLYLIRRADGGSDWKEVWAKRRLTDILKRRAEQL